MESSETHRNEKKIVIPLTQSLSGEVQPYLHHVTPRVPKSIHAKFHADRSKTVGARGIWTAEQTKTNKSSCFNYMDFTCHGLNRHYSMHDYELGCFALIRDCQHILPQLNG